MLDSNERVLRREKWGVTALWFYAVTLVTVFLLVSGFWKPTPERSWLASLAGIGVVLLAGAVELVKHFINRSRVELLKEVKQVELRLLEMQEQLRGRSES